MASAGLLALALTGCGGGGAEDSADSSVIPSPEKSASSTTSSSPSSSPTGKRAEEPTGEPTLPELEPPSATDDPDDFGGGSDSFGDDADELAEEDLSITRPPKLTDAGEVLIGVGPVKGNRTIKAKPVALKGVTWQLNCQGEGTISIAVEPFSSEREGPCQVRDVGFMGEGGHGPETKTLRSVVVKAPATVRWTLTVARSA
ncbi:hypothetical protein [Streptomyces cucumeris]|uniref:hypothetical protein n=1 Tax=Streptomyces cucumeris TaxID=2962890 RepID=UPI003EB9D7FF